MIFQDFPSTFLWLIINPADSPDIGLHPLGSQGLQVGAPFDQPRMSVMARLSVAQAEAKEVEATKAAPTAAVMIWAFPEMRVPVNHPF